MRIKTSTFSEKEEQQSILYISYIISFSAVGTAFSGVHLLRIPVLFEIWFHKMSMLSTADMSIPCAFYFHRAKLIFLLHHQKQKEFIIKVCFYVLSNILFTVSTQKKNSLEFSMDAFGSSIHFWIFHELISLVLINVFPVTFPSQHSRAINFKNWYFVGENSFNHFDVCLLDIYEHTLNGNEHKCFSHCIAVMKNGK